VRAPYHPLPPGTSVSGALQRIIYYVELWDAHAEASGSRIQATYLRSLGVDDSVFGPGCAVGPLWGVRRTTWTSRSNPRTAH